MKRYKCIKHIPFDIEVSKNNANEVSYVDMIFEYCYTVNNGDIYLKHGDTIITVTPEVLNHFFEEMEEKCVDNVQKHMELCEKLNKVYKQKNEKYGDSFGISVQKYGLIAALTRISDKFNRFEQLVLDGSNGTNDESLMDTCLDAANYFIMTVMELEK